MFDQNLLRVFYLKAESFAGNRCNHQDLQLLILFMKISGSVSARNLLVSMVYVLYDCLVTVIPNMTNPRGYVDAQLRKARIFSIIIGRHFNLHSNYYFRRHLPANSHEGLIIARTRRLKVLLFLQPFKSKCLPK